MISRLDQLTPDGIVEIPFNDPQQAVRLLQDLAGRDISDDSIERLLPVLANGLSVSADPDRALVNFSAWMDAVGNRSMYYRLLSEHPAALEACLTIFAASQFLSDLLLRTPEYFEVLANPTIRDRPRSMDDFLADATRRIGVARTPGMKRDALRRFKPPEVLRIGARDILGYATLTETVAEISDFAEACIRAALSICGVGEGFAVIGMGKLGGRELNYASDIDLIFVHSDEVAQADANKMGEAVRDTLAQNMTSGFVFRVDLRLRPEGRFGPVSRSLSSCRAYYESWAENWERQALLKARVVGGDADVGAQFMRLADAFVFRKMVQSEFVEDIQKNKRMIERQTARNGEADTNVKQGVGGIRDIEFAIQLLQLIAGGKNPQLRTGNTLEALDRLVAVDLLSDTERGILAELYIFLRNVEHRLQIMDERPVRNIPANTPRELDKFGRRLGYQDSAAFLADYRRHTRRVNDLFRELFYGERQPSLPSAPLPQRASPHQHDADHSTAPNESLSDLIRAVDDPVSRDTLRERIAALGFLDTTAALEILHRSERGTSYGEVTPEARERFAQIAPAMLDASAATSAPDRALSGLDRLADIVPSRAALYRTLADEPAFLTRLALLAAEAPFLWQTLLRHLEYLDLLGDEGQLDTPPAHPSVTDGVASSGLETPPQRTSAAEAVASLIRRERLRIGARDVWGLAGPADAMADMTRLASIALQAALNQSWYNDASADLAIVGMGKLGGAELGYGSDLDVLWVLADGGNHRRATQLATVATALLNDGMKAYGVRWETDARLRPDGRVGTLVRTVADYEAYYASASAQTWEKQALIKARHIAGPEATGHAFEIMAKRIVYSSPLTEAQAGEVRHMKHRIERERCKDEADIKLGPGGLSDIEWIAQMLQWRNGARWTKAQAANTLTALTALRDAGVLRQDDWELLGDTYLALTALRNRVWLLDGRGTDVAPDQPPMLTDQRHRVREVFGRLFEAA